MNRVLLALALLGTLTGASCAPVIAAVGGGVGIGVAVNGAIATDIHDCKADGGCKDFRLPP
jgi:hypothetical protein